MAIYKVTLREKLTGFVRFSTITYSIIDDACSEDKN